MVFKTSELVVLANNFSGLYNTRRRRVTSSGEERFLHTEEVTGSNPVSPTKKSGSIIKMLPFYCYSLIIVSFLPGPTPINPALTPEYSSINST